MGVHRGILLLRAFVDFVICGAMASMPMKTRVTSAQQERSNATQSMMGLGFGFTETGYDPTISRNFASLASMTYCTDMTHVLDWTCDACKESGTKLVPGQIRVLDGAESKARIVVGKLQDQNGCLMAFRGSDNLMNWITDFEFFKTAPISYANCDGCMVHGGFYGIWKNMRDPVLKALNEVGCSTSAGKDNLLYITGHSMGASLTHLAMFDLNDKGWTIAKTYSFEAPRVGNQKFSDTFNERFTRQFPVFRVTHYMDPVVHLPPTQVGYAHVPTEVWYDGKDVYHTCQGSEDPACADQFWNIPSMVLFHSGDHCGTPLLSTKDICNPTNCGG